MPAFTVTGYFLKFAFRTGKLLLVFVFTLLCAQYFRSNHYAFAKPAPFSGVAIFNPYASLNGIWIKSNFHAHSKAWSGLTNGHQTAHEIMTQYKENLKYDISCISNYFNVTNYPTENLAFFIPVYEHGCNIRKVHQLVFGNKHVCFYDMSLWQTADNKQSMIDHLAKNAPVVCLNHPSKKNGYTVTDLQKLSGYQLMEVVNTPVNDERLWDMALSAGKLSWIIANDDCHDIRKPGETGSSWTLVNAPSKQADVILNALKNGHMYGVIGKNAVNTHLLNTVKVKDDVISITVDGVADEIRLIGQGGVIKKTVTNTDSVSYRFAADDSYIRAVIQFPELTMLLNPLIRYDGKEKPDSVGVATIDHFKTAGIRGLIFVGWCLVLYLAYKRKWQAFFSRQWAKHCWLHQQERRVIPT